MFSNEGRNHNNCGGEVIMESVILRQWFPKCVLYDSATVLPRNFLEIYLKPLLRSIESGTLGTELSRLCFNKPFKHFGRTFTLEDHGPCFLKTSRDFSGSH